MRGRQLTRGDHLKVRRSLGYEHHAIFVGNGWVVHYSQADHGRCLEVRYGTLADFAAGSRIEIVEYGMSYLPDLVVQHAVSRINETSYSLAFNNCEHFARWCKVGEVASVQVERVGAATFGAAAAGSASRILLASLLRSAAAEGLVGGPAVMRGLKLAGTFVRGGAAAGLGLVASVPLAAANIAMRRYLRDDPFAPAQERTARTIGRAATLIASGVGIGAAVWTVSAGGVAGLSAVGISSGLAAVGSFIGGGMLAGLGLVALGPAVLACGLGYLFYRLCRPVRKLILAAGC